MVHHLACIWSHYSPMCFPINSYTTTNPKYFIDSGCNGTEITGVYRLPCLYIWISISWGKIHLNHPKLVRWGPLPRGGVECWHLAGRRFLGRFRSWGRCSVRRENWNGVFFPFVVFDDLPSGIIGTYWNGCSLPAINWDYNGILPYGK